MWEKEDNLVYFKIIKEVLWWTLPDGFAASQDFWTDDKFKIVCLWKIPRSAGHSVVVAKSLNDCVSYKSGSQQTKQIWCLNVAWGIRCHDHMFFEQEEEDSADQVIKWLQAMYN